MDRSTMLIQLDSLRAMSQLKLNEPVYPLPTSYLWDWVSPVLLAIDRSLLAFPLTSYESLVFCHGVPILS